MTQAPFVATTSSPEPGSARRVTVIEPREGWQLIDLRELWEYRELLWVLSSRDVRVRYRQTLLGAGWAIVRPLLSMVVFSLVFGKLAGIPSDGYPYPIFVYTGLVPWTFFSSAVNASGASLIGSAGLITKVYFPRLLVPLASVGAVLVDLLVSSLVLLAMMAWYHVPLTSAVLATPFLLALLAVTAVAAGVLIAALSVSYRDLQQVVPFLLQLWLYVSPVIYPVSLFPERWRWVLFLNPITGLVEGFRAALLGKPVAVGPIVLSGMVALALLATAAIVFQRFERRFADLV